MDEYEYKKEYKSVPTDLNEKQQIFYDDMIEKIENKECGIVILDADAGKGKTYVLTNLPNSLFLAPTHKASIVLKNNGIYNVFTIHRFLCWEMEYDKLGNEIPIYNGPDMKLIEKYHVHAIIVDEASMVNKVQYLELLKMSKNFLIIFSGDHCQLPPINEDLSLVFKSPSEKSIKYTLDINMRLEKDKDATALIIRKFRSNVINNYTENNLPFEYPYMTNSEGILELIKDIKNGKDSIYLSFSNINVKKVNDFVRYKLHIKNFPDGNIPKYIVGEKLIFSGYYSTKHPYYSNKIIVYHSSTIIDIKKVEIKDIKFNFSEVLGDWCDKESKPIKMIEITDEYNTTFHKPFDKKEKDKYDYFKNKIKDKIITIGSNNELWKSYYRFCTKYNTDLKHNYSMTIYKAQGSGYDNIYFNQDNTRLCTGDNLNLYRKCCYTAVSRTRKNVSIIPFNPFQ